MRTGERERGCEEVTTHRSQSLSIGSFFGKLVSSLVRVKPSPWTQRTTLQQLLASAARALLWHRPTTTNPSHSGLEEGRSVCSFTSTSPRCKAASLLKEMFLLLLLPVPRTDPSFWLGIPPGHIRAPLLRQQSPFLHKQWWICVWAQPGNCRKALAQQHDPGTAPRRLPRKAQHLLNPAQTEENSTLGSVPFPQPSATPLF